MVGPIIRRPSKTKTTFDCSVDTKTNTSIQLSGAKLDQRLREKRSEQYMKAMMNLDANVHVENKKVLDKLKAAIQDEFEDLPEIQRPEGIISRCYLGEPYEVHTLSIHLDIITHYKRGESIPPALEKARKLALHPSYKFIEVFSDQMVAVSHLGQTAILKG